MITTKAHRARFCWQDWDVPEGLAVIKVPKADGMGNTLYALANPTQIGVNPHDAKHYYFFIEAENLNFPEHD